MARSEAERGRMIYGGSFNPVHIGHLRIAIEARMLMKKFFSQVDFVPTAYPPHKTDANLLPFSLRADLIRASLGFGENFVCNEIEISLPAPSYSVQTLKAFAAAFPGEKLYFLLGSRDFALLPEWREGLDLPRLCDLVVAPRSDMNVGSFLALCRQLWPGQVDAPTFPPAGKQDKAFHVRLACGARVFFLQIPFLDVSSTYFRRLWLAGENVDFLAPAAVIDALATNHEKVALCWGSEA